MRCMHKCGEWPLSTSKADASIQTFLKHGLPDQKLNSWGKDVFHLLSKLVIQVSSLIKKKKILIKSVMWLVIVEFSLIMYVVGE